jgi:hypothetical protein
MAIYGNYGVTVIARNSVDGHAATGHLSKAGSIVWL